MPCAALEAQADVAERSRLDDANGLLMVTRDALDEASTQSFPYGVSRTDAVARAESGWATAGSRWLAFFGADGKTDRSGVGEIGLRQGVSFADDHL